MTPRRARLVPLLAALLASPLSGCKKPDEQAARLLTEADGALARQQWDQAFAKAHEAALLGGVSEGVKDQARLKEEQARAEMQAQSQYARFVGALDNDVDTAVGAYRDLPQASYYRQQGKESFEKVRPQYVSDHLGKAEGALKNGRCDDWKAQVQLVLDIDPSNGKALELRKASCEAKKE